MKFMLNTLIRIIPKPIKSFIKALPYYLQDTIDILLRRRAPLIPPTWLMFNGPRSAAVFIENGEEFLSYYTEICGLKTNERILDVGSGIGRKTIPLIKYLDEEGCYEAFDVSEKGINWCRKKISSKYTNFNFRLVNVYNGCYNPKGEYAPSEFEFPYDDGSFDFVVLASVFTRMLPDGMENYFKEINRVLDPNKGRCLISYFLLNDESMKLIGAGKSTQMLNYETAGYRTVNPDMPECAVGYPERYVLDLYTNNNLEVKKPIHYGSWCGRDKFLSYQDIIIANKI